MTTLQTTCKSCGTEMETEIPEGVVAERTLKNLWENAVICDDCFNKIEAKRNTKTDHQKWEELKRKAEHAGLPVGLLSWSKEMGNNDLLARVYENRGKSLFLAGPQRTGKTRSIVRTCATMLWHHAIEGSELVYLTMPALRKKVSSLARSDDYGSEEKFYKRLDRSVLLIIDDMDKGAMTDAGLEALWRIVDDRVVSGRQLWVTANEGGQGMVKKWVQGHDHRIETAEAIRARLAEICSVITVEKQ